MENRSTIFGIIALIIGAGGLGVGTYSAITLQLVEGSQGPPGQDGTDGIDGIDGTNGTDGINGTNGTPGLDGTDGIDGKDAPGYYCSTAAEVQQALESIGSGSGTVIINESITLSGTLNISSGGNYLIQGRNPFITINVGGDWVVFNITNTLSCTIQNLRINSTGLSTTRNIIEINEMNDNPVCIENIEIFGDFTGYGVYILSDNVEVSNCYFDSICKGVVQPDGGGNNTWVYDNTIVNIYWHGMQFNGHNNYVDRNILRSVVYGISFTDSDNNTIKNNIIDSIKASIGIGFSGENYLISDNLISNAETYGIISSDTNNTIISGNSISYTGNNGIYITHATQTVILGNIISNTEGAGILMQSWTYDLTIVGNIISSSKNSGIWVSGSYSSITGNIITSIDVNLDYNVSGILIWGDFNTINGNEVYGVINGHVSGEGIGIWIHTGGAWNVVMDNVAIGNDDNWFDQGTSTIGDETTNLFP